MYKWFFFIFVFSLVCLAKAEPRRVIIIRHGEKISDDDSNLSQKGCERAYLLPQFFTQFSYDVAAIYAQQANKVGGSIRSMATIAPTAKLFQLPINNRFRRKEFRALAQEILESSEYKDKTIIVSWEHSAISDIAEELGVDLLKKFNKWPSETYDQAWILTFKEDGKIELEIIAEYILPTDIDPSQSGLDNWGQNLKPIKNDIKVPDAIASRCQSDNSGLDQMTRDLVTHEIPGF